MLPVYFKRSGGQVHDIVQAEELVTQSPQSAYGIADQGYDNEKVRAQNRLFLAEEIAPWEMMRGMGAYTHIDISWKIHSQESSISEQEQQDMTS